MSTQSSALKILKIEDDYNDNHSYKIHADQIQLYTKRRLAQPTSSDYESAIVDTNALYDENIIADILPGKAKRHINNDKFLVLQKWEGYVTEVSSDSFFADLVDKTTEGIEEEAEFPIEEVSLEDRELIKPGAVFYWSIGYHDAGRGQRTKSSMIRFRRLPAWTKKEIQCAEERARQIRESINWK